jgi:GTP-binding protein
VASQAAWLAVNKAEGLDAAVASSEFHSLGIGEPHAVSATHGDYVSALIEAVLDEFDVETEKTEEGEADDEELRIAVIGRPNVGKSTLVNRLLGEDRLVVFDQPGTTRDSVAVPFERNDRKYVLIDTAGIRRRSRVHEAIEKFSIIKALCWNGAARWWSLLTSGMG